MMATCSLRTYHPSCMLYGFISPHPIEIWLSLLSLQWKLFSLNISNFELLKQFSILLSVSTHPVWRVWYWKLRTTLYFLKLSALIFWILFLSWLTEDRVYEWERDETMHCMYSLCPDTVLDDLHALSHLISLKL